MAKQRRFLSSQEAARREKQAHDAARKPATTREVHRREERDGERLIFDAATGYRLKYELSVPGGPLRGEYPRQTSHTIVAANEADLTRGILVALIDAYGFTRIGRAVSGLFAEVINPVSQALRAEVLMQIAQGTGLQLVVQDVTSCVDCGVEQDATEILDPNAPEGQQMEVQDRTQHAETCATQQDTEDGVAKVAEYRTAPALLILHPARYAPLATPGSADEQPGNVISHPTLEELAAEEAAQEAKDEEAGFSDPDA